MPDTAPACTHVNFTSSVNVQRRDRNGAVSYTVELAITCVDCNEIFNFIGFRPGFSANRPTVSEEGDLVSLPIGPSGKKADQK